MPSVRVSYEVSERVILRRKEDVFRMVSIHDRYRILHANCVQIISQHTLVLEDIRPAVDKRRDRWLAPDHPSAVHVVVENPLARSHVRL